MPTALPVLYPPPSWSTKRPKARSNVATLPEHVGGVGDISPATAFGVLQAMRRMRQARVGRAALAGRTVALQGLGMCGAKALTMLVDEGARVVVADTSRSCSAWKGRFVQDGR